MKITSTFFFNHSKQTSNKSIMSQRKKIKLYQNFSDLVNTQLNFFVCLFMSTSWTFCIRLMKSFYCYNASHFMFEDNFGKIEV